MAVLESVNKDEDIELTLLIEFVISVRNEG